MSYNAPVAQWPETPGANSSVPLLRLYWWFDPALGDWTMTSDPLLEEARRADLLDDGTYTLTLLADIPLGTPVLALALRDGITIIEYGPDYLVIFGDVGSDFALTGEGSGADFALSL